jgi:hypothetical protein
MQSALKIKEKVMVTQSRILFALLFAICFSLAITAGQAFAQTPPGKLPALVGTWHVTFERPPGPPGNALVTFISDGTSVRTTDRSPVMSASHGAWVQLSEREFEASWNAFQFDDKGTYIGNQKASFRVRFEADSNKFTGDAVGTNLAFDGTVRGKIVGPFKGTRVVVEPYVKP